MSLLLVPCSCLHRCDCVEKAQALPPLRGCEASTRLLQQETELCQQVLQFLTLTLTLTRP